MKKILTVAAVLLPLVATAQYEPSQPPPSQPAPGYAPSSGYAPAPAYPPGRYSRRSPWYIGFGLGTGNGNLTDELGDMTFKEWNSAIQGVSVSPTNVTLNFKVGATLSPNFLLGLDITAIRSQAEDQGWTSAVQVNNYDAVLTWFPMGEGPFLRGGAGLSAASFSLDTPTGSSSDSLSGFNFLVGGGYALWIGQSFNLTFNIDYSVQNYGSGTSEWDGSNFWNLWVGFDWY